MKNPNYLETVARNHARIAAMLDKRTADMLASGNAREDLTLAGEVLPAALPMVRNADLQREEPEQGRLFG